MHHYDLVDAIGYATYDKPDRVVNGFHCFFEGYFTSDDNDRVVGRCLAWNMDTKQYAVSILGGVAEWYGIGGVHEWFDSGRRFNLEGTHITKSDLDTTPPEDLISRAKTMKVEALERLYDLLQNTTPCSSCGKGIRFGQFPFCPHEYTLGREPRQFQPIVVDRIKLPDGQYAYSYPDPSTPPDPGYERVSLTTLSQADRFVKDRNVEEQELRRVQIQGERAYWDERAKERRAKAQLELERRLGKSHSRIGDLVQQQIDLRREKRYRELESRSINFHNQALSFDSSHRPEHRDESKRKISVVVNGLRR